MKRIYPYVLFLVLLMFQGNILLAQQFIAKQYAFRVDSNVVYAVDTNYLGYPETLVLDLYHPIGDSSTQRPLLVYVHGGSWIGGTQSEYYPAQISREFAQRGYVVAAVQYRLGMHTNPNINPGANCPLIAGPGKCAYVFDSIEVHRANYRAMQDVKSALRFLKANASQDSVCSEAAFIAGESAGAITALAVALMDKNSERFDAAAAQVPASPSNSSLAFCQQLFNHLPQGQLPNYSRPDLGDVSGRTNLNGSSDKVKAVAAFYGAVFTEALSKDWINGIDTPAIYLFHQANDFVVGCGTARPIMGMNQCIPYINFGINDCVPYNNTPYAYGSCSISNYLQAINYTATSFQYISNFIGNPLLDCAATAQSGQGHSIDNIQLRCDTISKFFAPIAIEATQNCSMNQVQQIERIPWKIFPNPCHDYFSVSGISAHDIDCLRLFDQFGREVVKISNPPSNKIETSNLAKGPYLLELQMNHYKLRKLLVIN